MDDKLQNLIDECRRSLTEAGTNPEHPWRLFTAANVDISNRPQSRYVVLRDTSFEKSCEVTFFTDQRSIKVLALRKRPAVSLCFFDPLARLQLEIKAEAELHNQDEVSKEYWERTHWRSLQCYYMQEAPGEKLPAPFMLKPEALTEDQAYRYFTVVKCTVNAWDILLLKSEGNQRAVCKFDETGQVKNADWIVP